MSIQNQEKVMLLANEGLQQHPHPSGLQHLFNVVEAQMLTVPFFFIVEVVWWNVMSSQGFFDCFFFVVVFKEVQSQQNSVCIAYISLSLSYYWELQSQVDFSHETEAFPIHSKTAEQLGERPCSHSQMSYSQHQEISEARALASNVLTTSFHPKTLHLFFFLQVLPFFQHTNAYNISRKLLSISENKRV